jgi:hypothetical protein
MLTLIKSIEFRVILNLIQDPIEMNHLPALVIL